MIFSAVGVLQLQLLMLCCLLQVKNPAAENFNKVLSRLKFCVLVHRRRTLVLLCLFELFTRYVVQIFRRHWCSTPTGISVVLLVAGEEHKKRVSFQITAKSCSGIYAGEAFKENIFGFSQTMYSVGFWLKPYSAYYLLPT